MLFERAELGRLITQNTFHTDPFLYIKPSSFLPLFFFFPPSVLSEILLSLSPSLWLSLFPFQSPAVLRPAGHSQWDNFHTDLSAI